AEVNQNQSITGVASEEAKGKRSPAENRSVQPIRTLLQEYPIRFANVDQVAMQSYELVVFDAFGVIQFTFFKSPRVTRLRYIQLGLRNARKLPQKCLTPFLDKRGKVSIVIGEV